MNLQEWIEYKKREKLTAEIDALSDEIWAKSQPSTNDYEENMNLVVLKIRYRSLIVEMSGLKNI